jgi:hypothetical protein
MSCAEETSEGGQVVPMMMMMMMMNIHVHYFSVYIIKTFFHHVERKYIQPVNDKLTSLSEVPSTCYMGSIHTTSLHNTN